MNILLLSQSLLCDPNASSPANSEAAKMYADNRRAAVHCRCTAQYTCATRVVADREGKFVNISTPFCRRDYNKRVKEVVEKSWKDDGTEDEDGK